MYAMVIFQKNHNRYCCFLFLYYDSLNIQAEKYPKGYTFGVRSIWAKFISHALGLESLFLY